LVEPDFNRRLTDEDELFGYGDAPDSLDESTKTSNNIRNSSIPALEQEITSILSSISTFMTPQK